LRINAKKNINRVNFLLDKGERNMKALLRIVILVLLVSSLAACAKPTTAPVVTEAPGNVTTEVTLTENEQWAKDNGLGPYQPATDDWAAIEAAAIKEGSICVYANSSKITKLQEPWEALYPDIKWDCGDTDGIDVKMRAEQEAGNVVGDVWFNSDGHILVGEFMPNQWVWAFVPRDVVIPEITAEIPFAVARHSVDVWGYNSEIHKDGCPLTNWWQLTESPLDGKVYTEDPMTDVSTMAKWATVAENGDKMAAAYKELYGVEWTEDPEAKTDAYGQEVPNAGWLWIKKFAQNHPTVVDEIDIAYASVGMDPSVEPGIGWTGWNSVEDTAAGDIVMAPCLEMSPSLGVIKTSFLAVANKAPHPNAAKLFIKLALTPEGYAPWAALGSYPATPSIPLEEGAMPLAEMMSKGFLMNPIYDWEWAAKVRDFWAISLLTPKSED
jgi:iron(III) transport system substrate-binding protein